MREKYGVNYYGTGDGFALSNPFAPSERETLTERIAKMIANVGGYETAASDPAMQEMFLMLGILTNQNATTGVRFNPFPSTGDNWQALYGQYFDEVALQQFTPEVARETSSVLGWNEIWDELGKAIAADSGEGFGWKFTTLEPEIKNLFLSMIEELGSVYDFDAVLSEMPGVLPQSGLSDLVAAYELLFGMASENPDAYLRDPQLTQAPIVPEIDDDEVTLAISEAQLILNQTPGYWSINPVLQDLGVGGDPPPGLPGFEDGGRTTVPSIFGEGSLAEWAIPEEHSDRTADLLISAAAASGIYLAGTPDKNRRTECKPKPRTAAVGLQPDHYCQRCQRGGGGACRGQRSIGAIPGRNADA